MKGKKPEINGRISEIREYFCGGNNIEFSRILGCSTPRASNLCNQEPNVGDRILNRILEAFPGVSRSWLYFGEGEMLMEGSSSNVINTTNQTGDNYQGTVEIHKLATDDISLLREIITEKDRRIEELTATIRELRELNAIMRDMVQRIEDRDTGLVSDIMESISKIALAVDNIKSTVGGERN